MKRKFMHEATDVMPTISEIVQIFGKELQPSPSGKYDVEYRQQGVGCMNGYGFSEHLWVNSADIKSVDFGKEGNTLHETVDVHATSSTEYSSITSDVESTKAIGTIELPDGTKVDASTLVNGRYVRLSPNIYKSGTNDESDRGLTVTTKGNFPVIREHQHESWSPKGEEESTTFAVHS